MAETRSYSVFGDFFSNIADRGRSIIDLTWTRSEARSAEGLVGLCRQLISGSGEASNLALSSEVLDGYAALKRPQKTEFFKALNDGLGAPREKLEAAARAFLAEPSAKTELALGKAAEPMRRELLRRLNSAPGATLKLVRMREDLLADMKEHPELRYADGDFAHMFTSWFNRGFLELRRIDWQTSAAILEKVIAYEAVHAINDWDDLRARIAPEDRRLYGFFHPRLPDEPLIFVEVALTETMAASVTDILRSDRQVINANHAKAAMFYSISNCQAGLKGISFGNFLIKQVVAELQQEDLPLKTFATLSPIPTLAKWISKLPESGEPTLKEEAAKPLMSLQDQHWADLPASAEIGKVLTALTAHYLLNEKGSGSRPADPVARFHLGNGARLQRINWLADLSHAGQKQSYTLMVNYLYKLDEIEKNHEIFARSGSIAASREVIKLARTAPVIQSETKAVEEQVSG